MEFRESLKTLQISTKKLASKYVPIIRKAGRQAFCKSTRFIATLQIGEYTKRTFRRGGEASARLYNRFIVRGEYTARDLAILFILAILIGASIKTVASDAITIGFEDYTLAPQGTLIDLNTVQKQVLRSGGSLTLSGNVPLGGVCSQ